MREIVGQHPDLWPDRDEAACKQAPSRDLFFPEKQNKKLEIRALSYCNGDASNGMPPCPLKAKCWEWAIYANEPGIWGGATEGQRKYYLRNIGRILF